MINKIVFIPKPRAPLHLKPVTMLTDKDINDAEIKRIGSIFKGQNEHWKYYREQIVITKERVY